jgi:hypothetical protein
MARRKAEPVADEPAAIECGACHYSSDYLPRVPNGTVILRCHRFPQPVEIHPDYWCGEYREKADA